MAMQTLNDQRLEVAWGSLAVMAFAIGGVLNRACSTRGMWSG